MKRWTSHVMMSPDLPLFRGPFIPEPVLPRRVIGPAHPHRRWSLRLHAESSDRAVVCRGMPSCSCYRRVDLRQSRTCVACVWPAAGPPGHSAGARLRTGGPARGSKTSCRDSHRPVSRPVALSGAIAGMTLRNEQARRHLSPGPSGYGILCLDSKLRVSRSSFGRASLRRQWCRSPIPPGLSAQVSRT